MASISLGATQDGRYVVAAFDRGLQLLEQLAATPDLGVTEIAKRMGITKSQAFRLLYTLELRGYVRKDPDARTYTLGYRCLNLADHVNRQTTLIRTAQPHMRELAVCTSENVHLVVREGQNSICIALEESEQPLRLYAAIGRRGPLHAGGGSTVLLAYAPDEVRDEVLSGALPAYTPNTLTDPDVLGTVLARVRQQGHHLAEEDLDLGAYSIATPIRNHGGNVIAALSIAGPRSRLDAAIQQQHTQVLVKTASMISWELGWQR